MCDRMSVSHCYHISDQYVWSYTLFRYIGVHHNVGGVRGNIVIVPDAVGGRHVCNGSK